MGEWVIAILSFSHAAIRIHPVIQSSNHPFLSFLHYQAKKSIIDFLYAPADD